MPTIVFALLCASLVVGLVLVFVGRRGRRLNDHPVCRWCGFDVSGTYPASFMCPECGGGLKRENGVRIGVRKRMVSLMVVGAAMVLLPLAPMGIAFYGVLTGANLNTWKPVGVLLWEAGMVGKPASEAIAKELVDRLTVKSLSKEQEETIAARVVELQKDAGFAWTDGWGEVCDLVKARDAFSAEQWKSLAEHCVVGLTLLARGEVRAGETFAVAVVPTSIRLPGNAQWVCTMFYQTPMLDGRVLALPTSRIQSAFGGRLRKDQLGMIQLVGSTALGGRMAGQASRTRDLMTGTSLQVPADLAPGEYLLTIDVDAQCADMQSISISSWRGTTRAWRTLSARVRVMPPDAGSARAIAPTEAETERLRQRLSAIRVQQYDMISNNPSRPRLNQPRYSISLMIPDVSSDMPLACEVFALVNEREVPLGSLAQGDIVEASMVRRQFAGNMKYLGITSAEPWWGRVDLVFRPKPEVALATLNMGDYYGGEVVVKGLDVVDERGNTITERPKGDTAKPDDPTPTDEPLKPAGKP